MTTLAGQLLLCDTSGAARIAPGYVRIEGAKICEVVESEIPTSADYGDRATLISPGFIDAHVHLSQFDMIGAHGMPLLDWLGQVTFPTERQWGKAAEPAAQRALRQCLSFGTTGICAYATSDGNATLTALRQATRLGMRGVIGHVMMDRAPGDRFCQSIEASREDTFRALREFPPGSRLAAAVTPRFAISCTEQLLAVAGELAAEHDAVIQTHLAETERECQMVRELFGGKKYVDVYRDAGLLGPNTILGHGIHLDKQDRQMLAENHCVVAHCPTANTFLRAGTMNRRALLDDGVTMALGSDVGAGYERSMIRVARAMIEAAASIGDDFPTAGKAWHQITAGNADALRWLDAGRLRVGDPADLLVIRPNIPWLDGVVDPLARLLWSWDDRWLRHTFLLGQVRHR